MQPRRPAAALWLAAASFLTLAAPFVAYLQHHRYGILQPEPLVFLAALAGAALLVAAVTLRSRLGQAAALAALIAAFADVQSPDLGVKVLGLIFIAIAAVLWVLHRNAAPLVAVAMAAMCAVSLIPRSAAAGRPTTAPGNRDLPLVVHIVLDEHIGVAGVPADLVPPDVTREFERSFVGRGFRLFGAAYSEFPDTRWSLPHLFNLVAGEYRDDLATEGPVEDTHRMTRNEYFATMAKAGYAIRVYQPDYLDVCAGVVTGAACHTYLARTLEGIPRVEAPVADKLRVLAGAYFYRSEVYRRARQAYSDLRQRLYTRWQLPTWNWERGSTAPVGSFPMFDRVATDLSSASRGDLLYAHFLLPHYPYVYDTQCQPRPIANWLQRSSSVRLQLAPNSMNTRETRAERYRLYFEQLACTRTQVARLLDAIPASLRDDAVVIVHGDHGSRINLTDPVTTAEARLQASDYADSYSTLFAVRAPSIDGGYETKPVAISCLLAALVESRFESTDTKQPCAADGQVFLRDDATPRARPLRAFWAPAQTPPAQLAGR